MADIFISHSSKTSDNLKRVGRLAELLSERWSIWWDDTLVGRYTQVIPNEIGLARCMVPVWTHAACASDAVHGELVLARDAGKHIVPARMEDCAAPFAFGAYSDVDFTCWNGESDHPALLQLVRKLATVLPPPVKPKRLRSIGGGRLGLPALFMSVSSHETQVEPLPAVQAVRIFGSDAVLVSAYDLLPARRDKAMLLELENIRRQGGLVLVDSGNYESSRLKDTSWTPLKFKQALKDVPHDWVFSFDVMEPSRGWKKATKQVIDAVEINRKFTTAPVLPIVHAPYTKNHGHDVASLPKVVHGVADALIPPMIAVPERELGRGLAERAATVQRIRQALDTLPFYQPLHLLGTGNPWSIVVLAAAGADSFDGLEWCRVVVDRETNRLNHFQHFDLFTYQSGQAESEIVAEVLKNENIDFNARAAFHNLDYFAELKDELRHAAARGNFEALSARILGSSHRILARKMPALFP
ncbi:TIR domain-containing protein [Comamonas aquatica]|uniref:TIR domain-containing protein n=2 Tax=Comamonas aquatica TaxID=225991 RepID=UPI00244D6E95|nr:TIR domain-containing protein [Comamonas aquatica]MDH0202741.1 TIR domain-containing protein [Comamonas aquatica]MDH1447827.1 TIR domain-containing protein [Comamonas aquatica]